LKKKEKKLRGGKKRVFFQEAFLLETAQEPKGEAFILKRPLLPLTYILLIEGWNP